MTSQAIRWVGFAAGALIVAWIGMSVVKTLIVPRRVKSRVALIDRSVRGFFLWIANHSDNYDTKDRILTFQGPIALLTMLLVWLLVFWLGFALLLWPLAPASFFTALREAGSSMLTLGIASHDLAGPTVVYFLAGGTGLVVVALLIAYLPTIYASFNRRETLVTLLQSRAGVPAWGPEILWRYQLVGLNDKLADLYSEWERWAADVAESHTNYPVLILFRSPHPLRSWVLGLLAVLDAAALQLATGPETAPSEARLCLRMGFTALREIADSVGIPYDPDPFPTDPIELTYEEFAAGVARIGDFPVQRTPEEAWAHFRGWRVNYESLAYALADYVVAPPGPWSGERRHLPGMAFVPQRPANRAPDEQKPEVPKIDSSEWRSRG